MDGGASIVQNTINPTCCYRKNMHGRKRCVWHAPIENKSTELLKEERLPRPETLMGAKLNHANLSSEISFMHCRLMGSQIRDSDVSGVDFSNADLYGVDFTGADLRGANLRNSRLSGAKLYDADLRNADLTGADLDGTYVKNTRLNGAILPEMGLSKSNVDGSVKGLDLERDKDESFIAPLFRAISAFADIGGSVAFIEYLRRKFCKNGSEESEK